MKSFLRILLPIVLVIVILIGSVWYLFVYDREFTRDILLECARYCETQGSHTLSTWFYNRAYSHANDDDSVAIELAQQYVRDGNYTKAEYTLSRAIADGGELDVYIALCRTYVEQDKILDAVTMLNSITNSEIKNQLNAIRPAAPQSQPAPGLYNQYIDVTLTAETGTLYAANNGQYPSVKRDPYKTPIQLVDGENSIYAVAIADNGLVSPLAVMNYTVGGVVKEMVFSDDAVESAVRTQLGIDDSKTIMTNDLWTIKEFTVPASVKSYEDLQYFSFLNKLTISGSRANDLTHLSALTNLTELSITDVYISKEDLQTIASLPQLHHLTLKSCGLSTANTLSNVTNLVYLDLSENVITDVEALSNMTKLTELYLANNVINSLSPLSGLSALQKLDVSSNTLTTLAPLSANTGLTWIKADENALTDLGNLGKLSALTHLSAAGNKLTSVATLSGCVNLTELNISSNMLTDISMLSVLTKLTLLDFAHNSVDKIPAFPTTCALVTITGTKNLITDLSPLEGLEKLNNVNMDYNEGISTVDCLAKCHKLIQVNVYGTKVRNASALTEQDIIVNYTPVS